MPGRSVYTLIALAALLALAAALQAAAAEATLGEVVFDEGLTLYRAGETAQAQQRFRALLNDPGSCAPLTLERAHFYVLKCLHRDGDFDAFEREIEALRQRNPASPAMDDAVFLYATFAYERGDSRLAGALADLFAEDPALVHSEYGERAAYLALRAHHRGHEPALFEQAYRRFVANYPDSANRAGADFLGAKVLLDQRRAAAAAASLEAFLRQYPNSTLVPDARIDLIHALAWAHRWERMFAETASAASALAAAHPRHAARALVEEGLYRILLQGDSTAAEALFRQAADQFAATSAGREAQQWLTALRDPQSVENIHLQWELGMRARLVCRDRLASVAAHRRLAVAARSRAVQSYLADAAVSAEERAETLYRVCFADFTTGHHPEAWERAQAIIRDFPGTRAARIAAPLVLAMCQVRLNNPAAAADLLRSITRDLRPSDPEAGHVYIELAGLCVVLGDRAGEAQALSELVDHYPSDPLVSLARARLGALATGDSALPAAGDLGRSALAAAEPPRALLTGLREALLASVTSPRPRGDMLAQAADR